MIQTRQDKRALRRVQVWRHGGIVLLAVLLAAAAVGPAHGNARHGEPLVSIQGNRLSATIDRVPLRDVLAAMAHEAPFTISVKGEVETEPVSITLHNVEHEQGLQRLLRGASYAMTYESASGSPDKPRLVELMVFGSEKTAPDSHVQAMGGTVKAMPLRNLDAPWEALGSALQDAEPTVREHAERLLEEVETLNTETRN